VNVTLIIYFIPYLYLFAAAIVLRMREGLREEIIPIPGGEPGTIVTCVVGFITTLVAILLALIPPPEATNVFLFEAGVIGACLACFAVGAYLYFRARKKIA